MSPRVPRAFPAMKVTNLVKYGLFVYVYTWLTLLLLTIGLETDACTLAGLHFPKKKPIRQNLEYIQR